MGTADPGQNPAIFKVLLAVSLVQQLLHLACLTINFGSEKIGFGTMKKIFSTQRLFGVVFALVLVAFGVNSNASAQRRVPDRGGIGDLARIGDLRRIGEAINVQIKLGEVTLESIDFANQTATLSLGLDVANGIVPVNLKDFDYRLRLADREVIDGSHSGTIKIGGRRASRVNLPVTVHLRSIPSVVWSAFTNRGRLKYDLDSAFTLPLFVTEKRFDQNFSGEVPLRSVVDAASILRARRMEGSNSVGGILTRIPW